MSTPQPYTTPREKLGIGLIVASGIIFAETYWQYRDAWAVFHDLPPLAIAFCAAIGGAVGGWLVGKSPATRLAAMVGGAFCNFGGMMSFQMFFGSSGRLSGGERFFGFGVGALPGIIIAGVWLYFIEKKRKANPPAG
jgi:hypothetical protein